MHRFCRKEVVQEAGNVSPPPPHWIEWIEPWTDRRERNRITAMCILTVNEPTYLSTVFIEICACPNFQASLPNVAACSDLEKKLS